MRKMVLDALIESKHRACQAWYCAQECLDDGRGGGDYFMARHFEHKCRTDKFRAYLARILGECVWQRATVRDRPGWLTSCNHDWWMNPYVDWSNKMRHCMFCGRRIVVQNVGTSDDIPTECDEEGA